MKIYELNVGKMVMEMYLMMLVVIVAGFSGQWWITLFAVPIFFSAILGIQYKPTLPTIPTLPKVKIA